MNQHRNHNAAAQNVFLSSAQLFANLMAIIATFFLTGPVYEATIGPVRNYGGDQYGLWMADLVTLLWGLVVALTIFAFARATLATAITMGALAIAARLFV